MDKNFILTNDSELVAQLKAANFSFLGQGADGMYVFVNDGDLTKAHFAKEKLAFTNVLAL